ncbi:glucose-6-phosphate isomerase [Ignavibacteria bacterium]
MNCRQTYSWLALKQHYNEIKNLHLRDMFAADTVRFADFSVEFDGIFADFSKNRITRETIKLLENLAHECNVAASAERMFAGKKINSTENRAVLHTALRRAATDSVLIDGKNIIPEIHEVLVRIKVFSEEIRDGKRRGFTGKIFTDIVNIGIGGSDLGPKLVCDALKFYSKRNLTVHFVSNIDSTHLAETLRTLNPETTLFIVSSKTFTTEETMTNARSARDWFLSSAAVEADVQSHFAAVSTNFTATEQFGINPANVFVFRDWVGGRYSLWSAIGLSVALSVGFENFSDLLAGARAMDKHFLEAPFEKNIPMLAAAIGVWHVNFFGAESQSVLPYDEYLRLLPAYLQQLDMESNGKSVMLQGEPVDFHTAPIIWGQPGTDSQHSFFQLLHQGTRLIPCDFIAVAKPLNPIGDHHKRLMANFFAQTEALMRGKTTDEAHDELLGAGTSTHEAERLAPHKTFAGNRPTTTFLIDKLTPYTLGALLAMYEHKVFVQGIIWGINSFDQWGVELGKQLAKAILPELSGEDPVPHDCSTAGLIALYKKQNVRT